MKVLLPIIFLGIAGALFFGYIDPAYDRIKELRAEESEFSLALDRSRELQQVRDSLLARYNAFPQDDVRRIEKLVPDHVDNVRLILDLDSMASKYGMRVRNVSIESSESRAQRGQIGIEERAYESVVLTFSVSGTYDTFMQFMTDIEESLRLVDVVGLSFSANESGLYDYSLNIKTYWLKP